MVAVADPVGRESELASLRAFVDSEAGEPSALVLDGEVGVGKSTLWRTAVEHARAAGMCVLSARPAEAERGLAYAGLGDLLEAVLGDVLPGLPAPRRRALEIALLLDEPGEPVDERALGIATRSALQSLLERRPVLVAVDDLQWFDPSSERALAFAVRRLEGTRLRLLLARRPVEPGRLPDVEQALAPESVCRVTVGPLSVGALHRLLRDRVRRPLGRQTLVRLHELSGGNPFFALELARHLDANPNPAAGVPVPHTLDELVRAHLADLPAATRKALALASAFGAAPETLLTQSGFDSDALAPALRAGVIELEDGVIRFSHPLHASVLYADLGEERQAVHGRLAQVVEDPVLRARHLALSADRPDAATAAELERSARLAAGRGAAAVAAELAEQALRLTPVDASDDVRRRSIAAARAQHAAGEWTRAREIADELVSVSKRGVARAEAVVLLAELESVDRAVELLERALEDAVGRPVLQSEIQRRLAWATRFRKGYPRAVEHARAALELAEQLDDHGLRARAEVVLAVLGWIVGDPGAPPVVTTADEFASALGGEPFVQEATLAFVNTFAPSSRRDEAQALLERDYDMWLERDEPRSARALWGLAWLELWAGRWARAARHAAAAYDISTQYRLELPQDHLPIAVVAVHRGRFDLAREHSQRALALAQQQLALHPPQHVAVLGLVALAEGDTTGAAARLAEADQIAKTLGWGEPTMRWWTDDEVELLLELGRSADAVRLLDAWEADAVRCGREWVLARATRCRGLVAAARGDLAEAEAVLDRAVAEHEQVGDPFGRARALLALGTVRRRDRQKLSAREAIEAAIEAFEAIGADAWAATARSELARVGGRRPAGDVLTPTEVRLAELVAEGRSNKEIAAVLFVTPKTVSTTLSRLYAKLGVHSRTELVRRLAEKL